MKGAKNIVSIKYIAFHYVHFKIQISVLTF